MGAAVFRGHNIPTPLREAGRILLDSAPWGFGIIVSRRVGPLVKQKRCRGTMVQPCARLRHPLRHTATQIQPHPQAPALRNKEFTSPQRLDSPRERAVRCFSAYWVSFCCTSKSCVCNGRRFLCGAGFRNARGDLNGAWFAHDCNGPCPARPCSYHSVSGCLPSTDNPYHSILCLPGDFFWSIRRSGPPYAHSRLAGSVFAKKKANDRVCQGLNRLRRRLHKRQYAMGNKKNKTTKQVAPILARNHIEAKP